MGAPLRDNAAPLSIEVHGRDGVPVVVVRGEIDLSNEDVFTKCIDAQLDAGPAVLFLDLRGVDYIGSAGLRVLVCSDERAREAGNRFVVIADHSAVLRPLEVSELRQVLDVQPTFPEPPASRDA
ncbi:STAS domain-containing protein [Lentzea sp.]|uniref:STAS domain-containing protein n=1 Tax=Lentzea sp. TaxID=56099 RepID=UPI002ED5EAD8